MSYFFTKVVDISFDQAIEKITEELKKEGFGILTEIDVKATLKKKIDVDFRPYKILGACNPQYAYKALQAEDKIGIMLPCNVVVQENVEGKTEVSVINPMDALSAVNNPNLEEFAIDVTNKVKSALDRL
ncbi:MAG: DUF302 domain-containing protein [Bacteroidetes bacterium]|nr:DUF302 domain-containing protein [Bacteroidota bacterium]MBU1679424.1 DUF302 domain-containing protein [Bacteroidota bacterium]MBU2506804.1 DUF302 domain-containing protein [Bacteroidota bacterium]